MQCPAEPFRAGFQYLRVGDYIIVLRAHRRVSAGGLTSAHCIQWRLTRMQEGNTTYYVCHFYEPPMCIVTEAVHGRECKGFWRLVPQCTGLAHQNGPFAPVSDTARSLMDKGAADATSRRPGGRTGMGRVKRGGGRPPQTEDGSGQPGGSVLSSAGHARR